MRRRLLDLDTYVAPRAPFDDHIFQDLFDRPIEVTYMQVASDSIDVTRFGDSGRRYMAGPMRIEFETHDTLPPELFLSRYSRVMLSVRGALYECDLYVTSIVTTASIDSIAYTRVNANLARGVRAIPAVPARQEARGRRAIGGL